MSAKLSLTEKLSIGGILIVIIVSICSLFSYINNIVKLTRCDFEAPYKAEICRGLGVIIPPVGVIEGFIAIEDGKK
jgi:hypothetical protein